MGGTCTTHGRNEQYMRFKWKNLKEKERLRELGVDGRIILKLILKKQGSRIRTGFI